MASSAASALGRSEEDLAEAACDSLRGSGFRLAAGAFPAPALAAALSDASGLGLSGFALLTEFALLEEVVTGRVIGDMRGGMGAEGIAEGCGLIGGRLTLASAAEGAGGWGLSCTEGI